LFDFYLFSEMVSISIGMDNAFPQPYPSQFDLRGESMTCYGSDFRNIIDYTFNNQGYRSLEDFEITDTDPLLVCLGSSIATGHGLELSQSFSSIIAQKFNKKLWNLGQGCFRSSNQTMLEQVEFLVTTDLNIDYWVIQFTHINRQGNRSNSYVELDNDVCIKNFCDILGKITRLLAGKKWCWLLTDWSGSAFPNWVTGHPNKIAIDPDSVDFVPVTGYEHLAPGDHAIRMLKVHPGTEWNLVIANQIIDYFGTNSTRSGTYWRNKQVGDTSALLAQEVACVNFLKKYQNLTWCWQGFSDNFFNYCNAEFTISNTNYNGVIIINSLIGVTPRHFVEYVDSLLHDDVEAVYLAINRYEFIPTNDLNIDYHDDLGQSIKQIVQHISKPFQALSRDCPDVDGNHFVGMHGLDIFVYERN